MKVIDMLNKIANGEEVVVKHKMFDLEFFNSKDFHIGYRKGVDKFILGDIVKALNDEVEVIEDKKIEKIEYITSDEDGDFTINGFALDYEQKMQIVDKINEIIDKLNELDKW